MGVREKIENAESTSWLTENMTEEEIQEIVTKAKEEAREQINKIKSEEEGMTREEKSILLNELLEYEENNDIGNLTRVERREFQQCISESLEQQQNRCDSCIHSEEQDGSNCYECVKGMADNFEAQPTDVDCISRAEAIHRIEVRRKITCESDPYNYEEWTKGYEEGIDDAIAMINSVPSVTPQPRVGQWILTDVEGNRVWHCSCSECGKDPQDYIGGSENWWLIKNKLPKYCPNCGSYNGGGEE